MNNCPECGGNILKNNVCSKCGLVISPQIVKEVSFRSKHHGPGTNILLAGGTGLGSFLSRKDRDWRGNPIPPSQKEKIKRLRKWQNRFKSYRCQRERAIILLCQFSSSIGIPPSRRKKPAAIIRTFFNSEKKLTGHSLEYFVAAVIYLAFKNSECPIQIKEIVKKLDLQFKSFLSYIRILYEILRKKGKLKTGIKTNIDPCSLVARICSKLELTIPVQKKAIEIIKKYMNSPMFFGKDPAGIAGGAIYVVTRHYRTQEEIAETAGVSVVTLRSRYQEMQEMLNLKK